MTSGTRRIPDSMLECYLAEALDAEAKARIEELLASSPEDRARLEALREDPIKFTPPWSLPELLVDRVHQEWEHSFSESERALLERLAPLMKAVVRNWRLLDDLGRRAQALDVGDVLLRHQGVEYVVLSSSGGEVQRSAGITALLESWFTPEERTKRGLPAPLLERLELLVGQRLPAESEPYAWQRKGREKSLMVRFVPLHERSGQRLWGMGFQEVDNRGASSASWSQLFTQREYERTLISVLGHEMGNPLAAIRFSTGALLLRPEALTPEMQQRMMFRINHSAERMSRILKHLLDFTRARMDGGIPLSPSDVALDEVCRRVISELEVDHPERYVHLEVRGNCHGFWDEERLAQVISSLVANALQNSPAGTPVSVRLEGMEFLQRVEVHDAGAPIPESIRSHIFEPLPPPSEPYRFSSRKNARGDLEFGLYISAQIIRAHGGRIEVFSSAHEGTSFVILLPRSVPAPADTVEDASARIEPGFVRKGDA